MKEMKRNHLSVIVWQFSVCESERVTITM